MTLAVIFDLDGTLVHSAPDIHAAVNGMLEAEGQPPLDLATVVSFIGHGLPKLVERVMAARGIAVEEHGRLTRTMKARYDAAPCRLTRTYPGVTAVLDDLMARGHRLGVCTNKPGDSARGVLGELGLLGYFGSVVGGDRLAAAKPDPAMLRLCIAELGAAEGAVMVGDSEVDAATALAADVPFVLFTEGYRRGPVETVVHAGRFADYAELPALLDAIGRQ